MPASPPQPEAALESVVQTALDVGSRIQMSGGYTARVRDSTRRIALELGADEAQTWLASGSLGITATKDGHTLTAVRTVPAFGVNFAELSDLSHLVRHSDGLDENAIRSELHRIAGTARRYPGWLVLIMMGVACGSLAGLFGAGLLGVGLAACGGLVGSWVRRVMLAKQFKPFVYCVFASFAAVSVVLGLALVTGQSDAPDISVASTASILFLVPGVPLLNGTADLLTSNYLNGVARLTRASVILLGTTFGLSIGVFLWGRL